MCTNIYNLVNIRLQYEVRDSENVNLSKIVPNYLATVDKFEFKKIVSRISKNVYVLNIKLDSLEP